MRIATVLVGLAERVLNVPEQVHKYYRERQAEFRRNVLPRLATGDPSLWNEFRLGRQPQPPHGPGPARTPSPRVPRAGCPG